jgi:hypothetical protein
VLEEAHAVGAELGLPPWWLNEQASSYVAPGGDPSASRVFDYPGLRVFAASPEHLLAMKALAARSRDAQDIRELAKLLDLHTVADVLAWRRQAACRDYMTVPSGQARGGSHLLGVQLRIADGLACCPGSSGRSRP